MDDDMTDCGTKAEIKKASNQIKEGRDTACSVRGDKANLN